MLKEVFRASRKLLRSAEGQSNSIQNLRPIFSGSSTQSLFTSTAVQQSAEERLPGLEPLKREDLSTEKKPKKAELLAAFTCNKCGERTGVAFSKIAYERGVVIARCSHCDVQHLISDQLGWFGERSNIEDILREKGQDIRRGGTDGVLALTPEDIASWSRTQSTQSKG